MRRSKGEERFVGEKFYQVEVCSSIECETTYRKDNKILTTDMQSCHFRQIIYLENVWIVISKRELIVFEHSF